MRPQPRHLVESADHALTLLTMLRRDGVVHVNSAAREMDLAPSTVHRLLQTLVFRGYAAQRPDRSYALGPALPASTSDSRWLGLIERFRPTLHRVRDATDETVHLIVRERHTAVILESVLSGQELIVSSRTGMRLPAERSSGGKALLARLTDVEVGQLYAGRADVDLDDVLRQLRQVRSQGFAISVAESERGITAVGVLAGHAAEEPAVAVSVSAPSLRYTRERAVAALPVIRAALREAPGVPSAAPRRAGGA